MPLNFLFERNIEMKNKEGCGCIDRAYFVYVTVLAIAPDDAIRQIARSNSFNCDICASDKEVWLEQQSQRT